MFKGHVDWRSWGRDIYIPGFKPEIGYGYSEFIEEEFLYSHIKM